MTDHELEEYLKNMREYSNELKHDKQKALEFLKKAGILDSEGKLTPQYKMKEP